MDLSRRRHLPQPFVGSPGAVVRWPAARCLARTR